MSAVRYENRQSGRGALIGLVVFWLLVLTTVLFIDAPAWVALAYGVPISLLIFAFTSLRTVVDDAAVTAHFRFGRPRRVVPLGAITRHEPVRNPWWYGLGLRLIPGGTLYNVWGLDAVEIRYHDGRRDRMVRFGTNDPAGLDAAITGARS